MYCTAPHCITVSLSAPASLRTAPNSWLPRTVEARPGVMWSKAPSETGDRYILTMLTDFLRRAARFKVWYICSNFGHRFVLILLTSIEAWKSASTSYLSRRRNMKDLYSIRHPKRATHGADRRGAAWSARELPGRTKSAPAAHSHPTRPPNNRPHTQPPPDAKCCTLLFK